MRTIVAVLVLLGVAVAAPGTVYYVSPGGSDSNNGTAATAVGAGVGPWQTLARAASQARAGDTVHIRTGTYLGAASAIQPANSGTAGSPITFRNYPGERPLQDCNSHGTTSPGYSAITVGNNRAYITFDGLTITRGQAYWGAICLFDGSGMYREGPWGNMHHITIQNCTVSNSRNPSDHMCMVKVERGVDILVRNCLFHNCYATDGNPGHASITYWSDRITFENCEAYDMDTAFLDKAWCDNSVFRHNYMHDLRRTGISGNVSPESASGTRIYENICRNTRDAGLDPDFNSPGVRVYNNTVYDGNLNGGEGGALQLEAQWSGSEQYWWNNISYRVSSPRDVIIYDDTSPPLPYFDFNCYGPGNMVAYSIVNGNTSSLSTWRSRPNSQTYGWDRRSLEANPLFVVASPTRPEDYHLQPGSPCVHRGTNYNGWVSAGAYGTPDIGAYPRGNDGTVIGLLATGAPYISITTPTGSGSYATSQSTVTIGGTASDPDGNVTSVTWVNSTGGSGTASGTTSWSIASVALAIGANTITVTAHDDGGNVNTAVIVVTYSTTPADTTAPYVAQASPASGATDVALDANISCHVLDAGAGVNQSSIVIQVNGSTVSPTISGTAADLVLFYNPPAAFSALQTVTVSIAADDLATTPNHLSTSWSFTTLNPVVPDTTAPAISQQSPVPGATGMARNAVIRFHLTDAQSGVSQGSIAVTVNGSAVTPTVTGTSADYDVVCDPPGDFGSLQAVNVVVNASDAAGNAMATASWSFTCSAVVIEPPPPPSNLAVYASTNLLMIQFSASTGPNVAGYYLYYRNGTAGYVKVNIGNVTSYVLTGLTAGATYHLQVTAYDTADQESDPTAEVGATVLGVTDDDDDDDDAGGGGTETPVKDLEVRPNRVSLRDGLTVEIVGPADALAGETVRIYGVSGGFVGETTLDEHGRKDLDPAVDLSATAGVYILYAGEQFRARLVITP